MASRVVKSEEALNNLGVTTRDDNEELLSTYEILKNLSPEWEQMTSDQKVSLGITLAGVNQYKVFAAVMNNFSRAVEAKEAAEKSAGMTMQQNAIYMQSLEALTAKLKAQVETLILGDGGLQNGAKLIVHFTTSILKITNTLGGLKTILVAISGILLTAKIESVSKLLISLPSQLSAVSLKFKLLANSIAQVSVGQNVFTLSTEEAIAAETMEIATISALQLAVGALTLAITAGVAAYSAYQQKQKELKENALESASALSSTLSELDKSRQALESETSSREELATALESVLEGYSAEGKSLDELNRKRQEAIDKINEQSKAELEQWYNKNSAEGNKAYNNLNSGTRLKDRYFSNQYEAYQYVTEQIQLLNDKELELAKTGETLSKGEQNRLGLLQYQESRLRENIDSNEELSKTWLYAKAVLSDSGEAWETYNDFLENSVNYTKDSSDSIAFEAEALQELKEAYQITDEEIQEYISLHEDEGLTEEEALYALIAEKEAVEGVETAFDKLLQSIQDLPSAYKSLSDAVDDYNDGEGMTASHLKDLIELSQKYAGSVEMVNGKMQVSREYFVEEAKTVLADAKAKLANAAQTDLAAIAEGRYSEYLDKAAQVANSSTPVIEGVGTASYNAGVDAANGSEGFKQWWSSVAGEEYIANFDANQKKAYEYVQSVYEPQYEALNEMEKSLDDYLFNVSSSSSKSASSSSDAWVKAFEKEKSALENLYKTGQISATEYYTRLYALGQKYYEGKKKYAEQWAEVEQEVYKGLQDALKDLIDEQKDQFKEAIDELKNLKSKAIQNLKDAKSAAIKQVESEIKALKSAKEEAEEFWSSKIDAFKKQNEELNKQNQLMEYQQALALAKSQKVLTIGENGQFGYEQDEAAVSAAEEKLYAYERQLAYEKELEDLEKSRDDALAIYEQKLEDLENYKDQLEEWYDNQIEATERYYDAQIEAAEASLAEFERQANELLKVRDSEANGESRIWQTRITNLANFVNKYNSLLSSLGKSGVKVSSTLGVLTAKSMAVSRYAEGTESVKKDEVAVVGEDPNKELVLGSKVNNGVTMNLSKGSGVVNSQSTKTLAGLLNQIGAYGRSNFGAGNYSTATNNINQGTSISIGSISLPQVSDGKSFVDYLQNFSLDMTQKGFA